MIAGKRLLAYLLVGTAVVFAAAIAGEYQISAITIASFAYGAGFLVGYSTEAG